MSMQEGDSLGEEDGEGVIITTPHNSVLSWARRAVCRAKT